VFGAETIQSLAKLARLRPDCNLDRFGKSVRDAASRYARDAATPSSNEQHHEVATLFRLVQRRDYVGLADAIEKMTRAVRSELRERQARVADRVLVPKYGRFAPQWRIPEPAEVRDPATRERAVAEFE
jgi:hypothetical protein